MKQSTIYHRAQFYLDGRDPALVHLILALQDGQSDTHNLLDELIDGDPTPQKTEYPTTGILNHVNSLLAETPDNGPLRDSHIMALAAMAFSLENPGVDADAKTNALTEIAQYLNTLLQQELAAPLPFFPLDASSFHIYGEKGIEWPHAYSSFSDPLNSVGESVHLISYALCFCGNTGIDILNSILQDSDYHVKRTVISAICDAYSDLPGNNQDVLDELLEPMLEDNNPWVVADAAMAIKSTLSDRYLLPLERQDIKAVSLSLYADTQRRRLSSVLGDLSQFDSTQIFALLGVDILGILDQARSLINVLDTSSKEICLVESLPRPELVARIEQLDGIQKVAEEDIRSKVIALDQNAGEICDKIFETDIIPDGTIRVLKQVVHVICGAIFQALEKNEGADTPTSKLVSLAKHCEMQGHAITFNALLQSEVRILDSSAPSFDDDTDLVAVQRDRQLIERTCEKILSAKILVADDLKISPQPRMVKSPETGPKPLQRKTI
ncbi:hypothetical protein KKF81_07075 [Candidatus Micrarchaeota archaeon]|nr:hypothetical protein [Candidatus Micrarchaeota archaeon]